MFRPICPLHGAIRATVDFIINSPVASPCYFCIARALCLFSVGMSSLMLTQLLWFLSYSYVTIIVSDFVTSPNFLHLNDVHDSVGSDRGAEILWIGNWVCIWVTSPHRLWVRNFGDLNMNLLLKFTFTSFSS